MKTTARSIIEELGGAANVARDMGVSCSAVSQWMSSNRIPANRAVEIEVMSGGRFRAINLPTTPARNADQRQTA